MTETRRSYCGLCHPRCGLLLEMDGEKVVGVRGDKEHPVTRGMICPRAQLMVDHLYHPERINFPLKRKGERGSGKFQRVGWDEALDDVDHGWWFPERKDATLFDVFESNANVLCPDDAKYCSPEIGGWPHTALLCRVEKE